MPDSTPAPTPSPKPAPKAARSDINQAWIDELTNAEQIVAAAQKPAYLPRFIASEIDAAKLAKFSDDIAAAKKSASGAVHQTTAKEGVTDAETLLNQALVEQIQSVQKRARQKFDATNPAVLKDYGIGKNYTIRRLVLEQTATDILTKLETDTLPAIDAAKIAALKNALDDYQKVQTDQSGPQGDATKARALLQGVVNDITARRREIQFAADAEWPHTDPAHAGTRPEFKLSPDRVMK